MKKKVVLFGITLVVVSIIIFLILEFSENEENFMYFMSCFCWY